LVIGSPLGRLMLHDGFDSLVVDPRRRGSLEGIHPHPENRSFLGQFPGQVIRPHRHQLRDRAADPLGPGLQHQALGDLLDRRGPNEPPIGIGQTHPMALSSSSEGEKLLTHQPLPHLTGCSPDLRYNGCFG
jgi:hypothetical protein